MNTERPIAVSLVAFEGIPVERALETIAASGATHVEPAYIAGTMFFSEEDFSEAAATVLGRAIASTGLGCVAVSAHMDCGAEDAEARLSRRLRFAAMLGARYIITNAAHRDRRDHFLRVAENVLQTADASGVAIAFENPGFGPGDLLREACDAAPLLAALNSAQATLNYDVGNTLTNTEGALRPETDLAAALPLARHFHLKDVRRGPGRWEYAALGDGELDYAAILRLVARAPNVPVCIELPFAQVRRFGAAPERSTPPPIQTVSDAVRRSVALVCEGLP